MLIAFSACNIDNTEESEEKMNDRNALEEACTTINHLVNKYEMKRDSDGRLIPHPFGIILVDGDDGSSWLSIRYEDQG